MELKIEKITISTFKGCKNKEIELNGESARLCGQNGSFKTTTSDAWFWVMTDTNTALTKNPDVVPIGEQECSPSVEIELTLDGKPLTVGKTQKFKSKEVDGKTTSSVTNTYSINGISKTYRDFVSDLESRGIDMEDFLIYSNPNAFMADTSKAGREKIRKVLFQMANDISDMDIAKEVGANDVVAQLKNYRLDEIKASAKATIKKITDENGKDNSIINGRISGMIESKSKLDKKVLEEQKANYEAEIKRIDDELSGDNEIKVKHIAELRIQKSNMEEKANKTLIDKRTDLDRKLREAMMQRDENQRRMIQYDSDIAKLTTVLEAQKTDLEKQRKLYKAEQDSVLDEDSTICPVCKREYDADKISEIKAEFEENKAKRLKVIEESGKTLKAEIKANEEGLKSTQNLKTVLQKTIDDYQLAVDEIQKKINGIPMQADMSKNKVYMRICKEIEEFDANTTDNARIKELKSQKNVNQQMLNQVCADLGVLEHNKEIDAQIEVLKKKRKDDEVVKAKAEKMVSQVEEVEKAKNEKLTESINKNFNIISFKLFDYLKNGNYLETIEILIDGKPLTSCANGSLIQLAKIDCVAGLQDFFEQHIPVFIDDAALITTNTADRIKINTQLIQLVATDNEKELRIERG